MAALSSFEVPKSLGTRVLLRDNVLHISAELRGNVALESYASLLRRQSGTELVWHEVEDFDAFRLHLDNSGLPSDNPVHAQAVALLYQAFEAGASDIHIAYQATHGSIRLRRMGMLEEKGQKLGGESTITLIRSIYQSMTESGDPQFLPTERQEGRIVNRAYLPPSVYSVRVHTEPLECAHGQGVLMTLRLLYDKTQADGDLESRLTVLGYAPEERQALASLARRSGLTLVAGPTGHGKSTLLKHVIESQALEMPQRSFLSIEDPPEYPIQHVSQILVGADAAQRGKAYEQAIAGAMRSDPDVLMIGEVRYPEAAAAAIDAALTGHTVWSSIHASSALGIVWRMLSLLTTAKFADPLGYLCDPGIMAGLIYQRLVPVLCPQCKMPLQAVVRGGAALREKKLIPLLPTLRRLRSMHLSLDALHVRGEGCQHCKHTGIERLTVAAEIIGTDAVLAKLLYQRNTRAALLYWKQEAGGRTSLEQTLRMVMEGSVDPLDAENRLGMPLDQDMAQVVTPSVAQVVTPSVAQVVTPSTAQDMTPSVAQDMTPSVAQVVTPSTAQDMTQDEAQAMLQDMDLAMPQDVVSAAEAELGYGVAPAAAQGDDSAQLTRAQP